jgi:membrane-associated phospholipid phosphatase
MPGLSHRKPGPGPGSGRGTPGAGRAAADHPLLAAPRRDAVTIAVVTVATAALFIAVASPSALTRIQWLDGTWLRLMISSRNPPLTAVSDVLNALGLVYVMLPVRLAIAGFLAARRRWWHLSGFAAAIILSEILIGPLKTLYDRPRPPVSLVATSNASFPSGHAVAASVTVVAAVLALAPPEKRRPWAAAAAVFALLMGLSRAYLGAHWLSDAVAGTLLGTSCALLGALGVSQFRAWRGGRDGRGGRSRHSGAPRGAAGERPVAGRARGAGTA